MPMRRESIIIPQSISETADTVSDPCCEQWLYPVPEVATETPAPNRLEIDRHTSAMSSVFVTQIAH